MPSGERRAGGRPKRRANSKRLEIANRAAAAGITPLEVICADMRYHWAIFEEQQAADPKKRDIPLMESHLKQAREAAKDAAPHIHPRLNAVDHSGSMRVTLEHALRALQTDEEDEDEK